MLKTLYHNKTLRLTAPFGRPAVLALIIVIVVLISAEIIFRQPAVQDHFPGPALGIAEGNFEVQWAVFSHMNDEAPFDCIFLGSSVTNLAINPLVFEEIFRQQTGESVHCFNFAVNGGTENVGLTVAELLQQDYHPRLLIFGVPPSLGHNDRVSPIIQKAWVRYRLGNFNVKGWLYDHSSGLTDLN